MLARRLDGILSAAGTVVALMLLPLAPPTMAIGPEGWAIAGVLALANQMFDLRRLLATKA